MKKLKTFEFGPGNGRGKYNWNLLLNGEIYELTRGVDFSISVTNFRSSAYGAAARNGRGIRIHCNGDDKVVMQGFEKPVNS